MLEPEDVYPGMPLSAFTAADYADIIAAAREAMNPRIAPPLEFVGDRITLARPDSFYATLSGASSPYSFTEKYGTTGGAWSTRVRTGTTNAYEVNGKASLNGKTVLLRPGYPGEYLFQWVSEPAASCTGTRTINVKCGGVNVSGATVTITLGSTTLTGTTDASGNVTFTPGAAGTWSVSATKSGYSTGTNSFLFTCGTSGNTNVTINGTTNTVNGNVKGCNSVNLPGATVNIKSGATVVATTTTDASGNYSVTWAGTGGSFTVEVNGGSRFNLFTRSTTVPGCNGTKTENFGLGAATGYHCDSCGGPYPIADTLTLTPPAPFSTVTLTYSSGLGQWDGTGTATYTMAVDCSGGGTVTKSVPIAWTFNRTATCVLEYVSFICDKDRPFCSGTSDGTLVDPSSTDICAGGVTVTTGAPTSYSNSPLSITFSLPSTRGTIATGTATITE